MRSTAQQVQNFTFSNVEHAASANDGTLRSPDHMQNIYFDRDSEANGTDSLRRSSDLYSPELNLEAHRTAQEVVWNFDNKK